MRSWRYIVSILFLILSLFSLSVVSVPDENLHLIACDVGQGDATLIIHKNVQILVDGGPNDRVLDCLGRYLPFWDREIELVILTHPDSDHFRGLIEVFDRYKVDNYLTNYITVSKLEYKVLEKVVGGSGATLLTTHQVRAIRLGLIYLDILAPSLESEANLTSNLDAPEVSDDKTNDYSIVSLVSFKDFRALLTGDMTNKTSDNLASSWTKGKVDYIKIPHHGSRNGLTEILLKAIEPEFAVISVGKKNNYGHPTKEILDMLNEEGVKTYRTDEEGDIEIISSGETFWIRK